MSSTATKEHLRSLAAPAEVLIKEARRRGRRHYLSVGMLTLVGASLLTAASVVLFHVGSPVARGRARGSVPPSTIATVGQSSRCSSSQVRVSFAGSLDGAGSENLLFTIENVSSRACSMTGYPRVSFVDPHNIYSPRLAKEFHIRVGYSVAYATGSGDNDLGGVADGYPIPRVFMRAHVGMSSFWIFGSDIQVGAPPYRCIQSAAVRIVLPKSRQATSVPGTYYFCGTIDVHPVVPGTSGAYPPKPLLEAEVH
jgi:hypothetical protein